MFCKVKFAYSYVVDLLLFSEPFSVRLPEKAAKNQVARQDPGFRGPEGDGDAKRAYTIEACTA